MVSVFLRVKCFDTIIWFHTTLTVNINAYIQSISINLDVHTVCFDMKHKNIWNEE